MNMTCSCRVLAAIIAIATLSACSDDGGPIESQTREVGAFSAVDIEGAAKIHINVGSGPSLDLEASAKALHRMDSEVRDGTLYIKTRSQNWIPTSSGRRVTVRIAVPKLDSLRLAGGHDVSLVGFTGGESNIKVEGAAKITASGQLDKLTVHLAGAGTANFSELSAGNAQVTVDGVGRVIVNPTETLDATMNGMGAIHYLGSPRDVRTRMNGLGHIGKQESDEPGAHEEKKPTLDPEKLQPEYDEAESWKKGGETEVI
jgi:hypothetical protein